MYAYPSVYACGALLLATIAAVLTWWLRKVAFEKGIIDEPNVRSSHSMPTPRGGGLAIVILTSLTIMVTMFVGHVDVELGLVMLFGGLPIAWIGFKDDRQSVPAATRFLIHALAAMWAMYEMGGLPTFQIGERIVDLGMSGDLLATIAIIWCINLFNFMDGIDGIAALEAIFLAIGGAVLCTLGAPSSAVPLLGVTVAATSVGFLVWNWPPAKIFMGDVGSGYLGYVLAVLALASARESPVAIFVWVTLGGVFFVDATVTLVRRLIRLERFYEAHRTHAYQWLARRWGHLRVTLLVLLVNVFWLLPMAWWCIKSSANAWWISIVSLVPLAIAAVATGAGRAESRS